MDSVPDCMDESETDASGEGDTTIKSDGDGETDAASESDTDGETEMDSVRDFVGGIEIGANEEVMLPTKPMLPTK
jgi:hypothetical protein